MEFAAGVTQGAGLWPAAVGFQQPATAQAGEAPAADAGFSFAALVDLLVPAAEERSAVPPDAAAGRDTGDGSETESESSEGVNGQEFCQVSWQTFVHYSLPTEHQPSNGGRELEGSAAQVGQERAGVATVVAAAGGRLVLTDAPDSDGAEELAAVLPQPLLPAESGVDRESLEQPVDAASSAVARSFARALASVTKEAEGSPQTPAADGGEVEQPHAETLARPQVSSPSASAATGEAAAQASIARGAQIESGSGSLSALAVERSTQGVEQPATGGTASGAHGERGADPGTSDNRDSSGASLPRPLHAAAPSTGPVDAQEPLPRLAATGTVTSTAVESGSLDDQDPAQQIVRAIHTQFRDGVGEARIRLRPDHLGEVTIALKVEGDRVSASLQVERADVRQAIEAQSGSLKAGLAAQGLRLEELSVSGESPARQSRHDQDPGRRGQPDERGHAEDDRRQRRRAPDREFELHA